MSDGRLRELEREFRATHEVTAERGLLVERMRAGDLDERQVHVAAYLGLVAPRSLLAELGKRVPPVLDVRRLGHSAERRAWKVNLRRLSKRSVVLGAVAACEVMLAHDRNEDPGHRADLELVRAWLRTGTRDDLLAVRARSAAIGLPWNGRQDVQHALGGLLSAAGAPGGGFTDRAAATIVWARALVPPGYALLVDRAARRRLVRQSLGPAHDVDDGYGARWARAGEGPSASAPPPRASA